MSTALNKKISSVIILAGTALMASAQPASSGPKRILTIGECQEMARQNNNDIRNARLDMAAARAQKQEALAEYFPKVTLNALAFWAPDPMFEIEVKDILGNSDAANNIANWVNENAPMYGIDPRYTTLKSGYNASVSLIQPVFTGGRIVSGNRLAALGVKAAGLQSDLQIRKSAEEIERSYLQILSLEEKQLTLDEVQKMLDNLHKDLSSAISAGLAVSTDMLQLRLKQNELSSARATIRGGIRLAKMNLLNSIGLKYTPYTTINPDNLPYIDDIVLDAAVLDSLRAPEHYWRDENEIVASREESRLLGIAVEARKAEKRMVLGEVLPQVGIGLSYGYGHLIGKGSFNGAAFATVKIPITDWGKYTRRLQRYQYQVQKAENDREYLSGQLLLQVRQQWFNLTVAWEKLQISEENVEVARTAVRQQTDSYKAGLIPLSELLEAQTSLRQSADAASDARIAYRTALTEYLVP